MTMSAARLHQFPRVVAAKPADDDHDVTLLCQLNGGGLPLFRWLADRVDEADFGAWKALAHQRHEAANLLYRLGRLRHDAELGSFAQQIYVVFREDDVAS